MTIWSPEELLKNGKIETSPITIDSTDGYMKMDLKVDGEDILIEVQGYAANSYFQASPFNADKQQLPVDVTANGMLIAASVQLRNAISAQLENVCLPEVDVKVDGFVKNSQVVYVSWPRFKGQYKTLSTPVGPFSLDDAKPGDNPLMDWFNKNTLNTPIKFVCRLFCWLKKEQDGKKVLAGITPTLHSIETIE